jgi:RNA-binding protein
VQLVKNADVTAKQAANELAEAVKADVVQVIGRTTTLYRRNPDLEHGAGKAPAWSK